MTTKGGWWGRCVQSLFGAPETPPSRLITGSSTHARTHIKSSINRPTSALPGSAAAARRATSNASSVSLTPRSACAWRYRALAQLYPRRGGWAGGRVSGRVGRQVESRSCTHPHARAHPGSRLSAASPSSRAPRYSSSFSRAAALRVWWAEGGRRQGHVGGCTRRAAVHAATAPSPSTRARTPYHGPVGKQ